MDMAALTLAAILSAGTPLVLATLGETLTERAGVINLSLDGTILLAAMTAFATGYLSGSAWLGLAGRRPGGHGLGGRAGGRGPGPAPVPTGRGLHPDPALCRDMAYFLGNPFRPA